MIDDNYSFEIDDKDINVIQQNDNTPQINDSQIDINQSLSELVNQLNELRSEVNKLLNRLNKRIKTDILNQNDVKTIHKRVNRTSPINTSKYLNEEQRDKVLEFIQQEDILNRIRKSNQKVIFVKRLVKESLGISLTPYMTTKIINLIKL